MNAQATVQTEAVISAELAAILATEIIGNAYHDMPLMDRIDAFLKGDAPLAEKLQAMKKLDDVMGVGHEVYTEADLAEYIEQCS